MTVFINKKHGLKFNIPGERDKVIRYTRVLITALLAISVILAIFCAVLFFQTKHVTIEAGQALSAADIAKNEAAVFGNDFDPDCVNHAGVYHFTVLSKGEEIDVRLEVKDTKAPKVTVKDVCTAVGASIPDPTEFIDTVYEPDSYTGEYVKKFSEIKSMGTYSAKVRFTDTSGNKTEIFDVNMTIIVDTEAPEIEVKSDIVTYVGEAVSYKQNITVKDNCTGEITLTVDDSEVELSEAGEYTAYVYATDAVGNRSDKVKVTVHVYSEEITQAALNEKIAAAADDIGITESMTAEQKCRAIYEYVYGRISYVSTSDKTSWQRAAYEALFVSGSGDCYSYFAAAKALLEYYGIENLDVQRTAGYTTDTHYWSLVNIGTEDSPRWYHFDCTHLRSEYNHSGCLLTDKQVDAYNKVRKYFRLYDKSAYPAIAKEIITPTPELENLY